MSVVRFLVETDRVADDEFRGLLSVGRFNEAARQLLDHLTLTESARASLDAKPRDPSGRFESTPIFGTGPPPFLEVAAERARQEWALVTASHLARHLARGSVPEL